MDRRARLTFGAADAPTYTVTCSGDYSAIIMPGMRMKMTQGAAIKYFIVTKVSYSSPNTTITLYGGTDYTLGSTITLPYYSMLKAPAGFPMSPNKWSTKVTDTTQRSQASPTDSTWYNLGSLSMAVPIGSWYLSSKSICIEHSCECSWLPCHIYRSFNFDQLRY